MGSNLIVNPGVTLTINPSVLITINGTSQFNGTVIVNGTLTFSSGSSLIVAGTGTLTVGSTGTLDTSVASSVTINGTYNHAKDGDNLPAATWAATSNCNITGMTSAVPIGLSQTFGNFTWNCATQGAGFNSFSLTIKGNLFLQNSNGRAVGLNTVVLEGNFTNNVGSFFLPSSSSFTFAGTNPQTATGATTFENLTINKTGGTPTVTLLGTTSPITVTNTLTLTGGRIVLGANNLTYQGTDANLSSPAGWIDTNNSGTFIRTLPAVSGSSSFPVGDGTSKRNVNFIFQSAATFTNPTSVRFVGGAPAPTVAGTNIAAGMWVIGASGALGQAQFQNVGTAPNATSVIHTSNAGAAWATFGTTVATPNYTSVGIPAISGSDNRFTVFTPLASNDYYTIGNTSWNISTNWSNTNGGADCSCNPSADPLARVFISHIVTLNSSVSSITQLTINSGGTLNAFNSLNVTGTGISTNIAGTFDDQSSSSAATYTFKDLNIANGGIFIKTGANNATYNFTGNIVNAGSFTMPNGSSFWSLGNGTTPITVQNQHPTNVMSFSKSPNGTGAIVGDVTVLDFAGGGNIAMFGNYAISITSSKTLTNQLGGFPITPTSRRLIIATANGMPAASFGGRLLNASNAVLEYTINYVNGIPATVYDFSSANNVVIFNNSNITILWTVFNLKKYICFLFYNLF